MTRRRILTSSGLGCHSHLYKIAIQTGHHEGILLGHVSLHSKDHLNLQRVSIIFSFPASRQHTITPPERLAFHLHLFNLRSLDCSLTGSRSVNT